MALYKSAIVYGTNGDDVGILVASINSIKCNYVNHPPIIIYTSDPELDIPFDDVRIVIIDPIVIPPTVPLAGRSISLIGGMLTRLLIFDLVYNSGEFDILLYLDTDTIIMEDCSELFDFGGIIGMVPEHGIGFNSGVIVIDIHKFYKWFDKPSLLQDYLTHELINDFFLFDQGYINYIIPDVVTPLSSTYNMHPIFAHYIPKIYHYFGMKPWRTHKHTFHMSFLVLLEHYVQDLKLKNFLQREIEKMSIYNKCSIALKKIAQ